MEQGVGRDSTLEMVKKMGIEWQKGSTACRVAS